MDSPLDYKQICFDEMSICQQIIEATEDLFECSQHREYTRIETPFIYPDGDIIDLYYQSVDPSFSILTDLGGVSDWLGSQTTALSRTEKQEEQIQKICKTYRVEVRDGEFFIDLGKGNEERSLTEAVFDLGQALVRIAGIWFLQAERIKNQIISSIESFFETNEILYEKNKVFRGASGNDWKTNFYVSHRTHNSIVNVLSTDSRSSTDGIVYRVCTIWGDLSHLQKENNLRFISLIDDRYDVWSAKQIKLLRTNSKPKNFSNRNELRNSLIGVE